MGYKCFVFGWNGLADGGLNDLQCCCDTIEEGIEAAQRLSTDFEQVQIMDAHGEAVII